MDITPTLTPGSPLIQRYGPHGFTIGEQEYLGAVIVSPSGILPWSVISPAEITYESLEAWLVAKGDVELLLIGSGEHQLFLPPSLRQAMRRHGLILDGMATRLACSTFNVLLGEGRRVAAALLPVSA